MFDVNLIRDKSFLKICLPVLNGKKYSRVDQAKFVKDSL